MDKNSSTLIIELQQLTDEEVLFVSGGECEGGTGHPITTLVD